MRAAKWPGPDATKAEIDAFYRASVPALVRLDVPPRQPCASCKHTHAGPEFAGICIGCPCPVVGGTS